MFILSYNFIWTLTYAFVLLYGTFVFSCLLYVFPQTKPKSFKLIEGSEIQLLLLSFTIFFLIVNFTWVSPSITCWFGHLSFANFQHKMVYLTLLVFYVYLLFFFSSFKLTGWEPFDFLIVCFNFYTWTTFLFFANSLFSVIFFIELLSTLILLLISSSTFATSCFYRNVSFSLHSYQNNISTTIFLKSLLFFFWVSLIASVTLFFSFVLFYTYFFTFEWNFSEFMFNFIANNSSFKIFFTFFYVFFFFFFCIFLKCGLVPFYLWKPTFFKGMPFHALFFYVLFFYFFIFLFFIFLFFFYLNEIFYVFAFLFNFFLLLGFLLILTILCDAFYLKTFLAMSSILNTLFVFLIFSSTIYELFFFM